MITIETRNLTESERVSLLPLWRARQENARMFASGYACLAPLMILAAAMIGGLGAFLGMLAAWILRDFENSGQ